MVAPFDPGAAPLRSAPPARLSGAPAAAASPDPRRLPHPPGPANYNRWIGLTWRHAWGMRFDALEFPARVGHRYGDLSSYLLFHRRGYLVNHPDLIHEFLVRRRDDYVRAPWQMRALRQIMGNGLLTSSGDLWLRQRRLLQQAFRADALPRQGAIAVETADEESAAWARGGRVDLVPAMAALSMAMSIRSTVGLNPASLPGPTPGELAEAIVEGAHLLSDEMENPWTPPLWTPLPSSRRKRAVIRVVDEYVNRAIAERRQDPTPYGDLLSLLLQSIDHEGDGRGMSDRQARDEAVTILLAGNHAVSSAMAWLWKLVLARPEVHSRMVDEVDRVLGSRQATLGDLPRLPYVEQALKETLRLFPAAWVLFGRQAIRETSLGGYRVRRGGYVFCYQLVTHRDPRFFRDPLTFDPERFSAERIGEIPEGAYFPFGHGPRVCLGRNMAMAQMTLAVATVLQRVTLTPEPGADDLTIRRELAIRPATPCWARVELREPPLPRKPR